MWIEWHLNGTMHDKHLSAIKCFGYARVVDKGYLMTDHFWSLIHVIIVMRATLFLSRYVREGGGAQFT